MKLVISIMLHSVIVNHVIILPSYWWNGGWSDAFPSLIGWISGSKFSRVLTLTSTSRVKWRRWQKSCRQIGPVLDQRPEKWPERPLKGVSDFWGTMSFYFFRSHPCCIVPWLTGRRWFCWTTWTSETPIQSSSAVWQVSMRFVMFFIRHHSEHLLFPYYIENQQISCGVFRAFWTCIGLRRDLQRKAGSVSLASLCSLCHQTSFMHSTAKHFCTDIL